MKHRKIIYIILGIIIIVGMICAMVIYQVCNNEKTRVIFLNIGQGDSILITKGSQQILIDGGPSGVKLSEQLSKYIPFWDRNIEIVVATHPDSDHIDGLISVFENYSIDQFWHTDVAKDTSVNKRLWQNVKKENGLKEVTAFNGLSANVGNDTKLEVIYPFHKIIGGMDDVNDASIAIIMEVADEVFYLGGDLSSEVEDELPIGEEITVLKASHHGSKSSTSKLFLEKTKPRDVIISAGVDNRYNHPHEDVLKRILQTGAKIFRTDDLGNIMYEFSNESYEIILQ